MPVRIPLRIALPPAAGDGLHSPRSPKVIRFVRKGCTNRPFYHIVVTEKRRYQMQVPIEQLGSYDPMPNMHNEKLVGLNFERINHWIGYGATMTTPVAQLLGLCGFYPIHPSVYMKAWRTRRQEAKDAEAQPVEEKSQAE